MASTIGTPKNNAAWLRTANETAEKARIANEMAKKAKSNDAANAKNLVVTEKNYPVLGENGGMRRVPMDDSRSKFAAIAAAETYKAAAAPVVVRDKEPMFVSAVPRRQIRAIQEEVVSDPEDEVVVTDGWATVETRTRKTKREKSMYELDHEAYVRDQEAQIEEEEEYNTELVDKKWKN